MAKRKGEETPNEEQNGGEQLQKKERQPRTTKHAKGSAHEILHTAIDKLSPTHADYFHRHIVKKALAHDHADPTSFEGEIYTAIKKELAS